MKIRNVEVFAVGTWNSSTYDRHDLDGMVTAFDELGLAGNLPVKLGHDTHDSEPAQGWITELSRVGDKLVATLDQVSEELVRDIKAGRFRHVSIELLGNVTRDGESYRWVPDGVAVLGAARPAVSVLKGLHELVASALPGLAFTERLAFSRDMGKPKSARKRDDDESEAEDLRTENARLTQELILSKFNAAIHAQRILPRDSHRFIKRFGKEGTLENAVEFIRDCPHPDSSTFTQGGPGAGRVSNEVGSEAVVSPDKEVSRRSYALMEERAAQGRPIQYREAARIVFKRDPELMQQWIDFPGTK